MGAVLAALIKEHGVPDKLLPTGTDSAFHGLAHIIIDQQLSILAAKCIANRVLAACGVRAQSLFPFALLCLSVCTVSLPVGGGTMPYHVKKCFEFSPLA
jgi:3-methyladenine DNA glycosylase/8-oxoguanine DNA glycosylase